MPGSFDDVLKIRPDGCLLLGGPTGLAAGEEMVRLDVWVFQKAGCMDIVKGPSRAEKWTAEPNHHTNHFGPNFEPGTAIAMGLMVKKDRSGATVVEQWSRGVKLDKPE